jgi:hypothetical protein
VKIMTLLELGLFEDDPRSQEGAQAINWLISQEPTTNQESNNQRLTERWGLEPDLDPRVVATKAAVIEEQTVDAYMHREAWVMQCGEEYQV